MQDFKGRTAVITGAASGIGRGIARACAAQGVQLVLADVDDAGLEALHTEISDAGGAVITSHTDVRSSEAVEALAGAAQSAFGDIHLVFNNAGVMLGGYAWERSAEDWKWVLDVNIMGVVHGVRTFMPILLEQGLEAHMVNTASIGGQMVGPMMSPYIVSKHAVVALTESIFLELGPLETKVKVSALCPGPISTGIVDSQRIRPEELGKAAPLGSQAEQDFERIVNGGITAGMAPDEVGPIVLQGIRDEKFWIYTHPVYADVIRGRAEAMITATDPGMAVEIGENMLDPVGE
jgi:NAD(P)-dependent dehydrogenase (short-subunit alcohol dehydrogenase family)